jgi:hypothetical protein
VLAALCFCSQCKKSIEKREEALFVDASLKRNFCSEECIEEFYHPLIEQFSNKEIELRKELQIEDEEAQEILERELPPEVLRSPDELYKQESEAHETLYSFIKEMSDGELGIYYYVGIGFIMDGQFSFLFTVSCSQNKKFVESFKQGEKIKDVAAFLNAQELSELGELSQADINEIERKKSQFLANHLVQRIASDIPFEKFLDYDECLQTTVEEPDEIFESVDEDGDEVQTFVKSFEKNGSSFYYLALCLIKDRDEKEFLVVPYMSFPTNDPELYRYYCKGSRLSGSLKS